MKKLLFIIFIVPFLGISQLANKESLLFEIGKPLFTDNGSENKSITLGVSYLNRFSETFSYDIFYHYAQTNEFPDFYKNRGRVIDFYNEEYQGTGDPSDLIFTSLWSKGFTHSLGLRIHYSFVNNNKWFFSFNLGGGMYLGKSSLNILDGFTLSADKSEIIDYKHIVDTETETRIFIVPGIHAFYNFSENYAVGINLNLYLISARNDTYAVPLGGDHYNISLTLGRHF